MIRVILTAEDGAPQAEAVDARSTLLAGTGDDQFLLLRYIDPYGDTVFNALQVPDLLDDLQKLGSSLSSGEDREVLGRIVSLCKQSLEEPHRYVKFVGD